MASQDVSELDDYIGKTGRLTIDMPKSGVLRVSIVVIDVKHVWGNLRFKVRPHDSRPDSGTAWVGANRVALDPL